MQSNNDFLHNACQRSGLIVSLVPLHQLLPSVVQVVRSQCVQIAHVKTCSFSQQAKVNTIEPDKRRGVTSCFGIHKPESPGILAGGDSDIWLKPSRTQQAVSLSLLSTPFHEARESWLKSDDFRAEWHDKSENR